MSDNLRRYRAIHQALKQWYPGEPSGRLAQHLTTLAAFISGIVGSKSSQLPSIATKAPDRAKPESRVKRLSRWLDNDTILEEVYFLPYAEMLLHHLAFETLVLVMDGSGVGRCSGGAGGVPAARPRATRRRGTTRRFTSTSWGRVSGRGG